jgi:hypothetical protein
MMVELQLCFGIGPASHGSCDPNATRRAGMISQGTESNLNRGTTSQKVPGYVVEHLAADSALMPNAVAGGNGLRHEGRTVSLAAISFGRFPSEPTCPDSETRLVKPVSGRRVMPNLRSQFLLQRRRRRCLDSELSLQKSAIQLRDLVVELCELTNLVRVAEERRQRLRSGSLTATCKAVRIFRKVWGPPGPRLVGVVTKHTADWPPSLHAVCHQLATEKLSRGQQRGEHMHKVSATSISPDEIEERTKEREAQVSAIPKGPARQSILVEIAELRAYADVKRWSDSAAAGS